MHICGKLIWTRLIMYVCVYICVNHGCISSLVFSVYRPSNHLEQQRRCLYTCICRWYTIRVADEQRFFKQINCAQMSVSVWPSTVKPVSVGFETDIYMYMHLGFSLLNLFIHRWVFAWCFYLIFDTSTRYVGFMFWQQRSRLRRWLTSSEGGDL